MRMKKRLSALLAAVMLLCSATMTAYAAHPVPDANAEREITVTMKYGETAVGGGSLTLYKVGDVHEDDGNYSFTLSAEFAGSEVVLENIDENNAELAKNLAGYARTQRITGTEKTIGRDGTVTFEPEEMGLYLLVQNRAASGYYAVSPFLVSVPMLVYNEETDENQYIYKVDASPKVEGLKKVPVVPEDPDPDHPSDPENPDDSTDPVKPVVTTKTPEPAVPIVPILPVPDASANTLPQTGQLNWPVPVLVVFGLGLFSAGWMLRYGKKKDENAK